MGNHPYFADTISREKFRCRGIRPLNFIMNPGRASSIFNIYKLLNFIWKKWTFQSGLILRSTCLIAWFREWFYIRHVSNACFPCSERIIETIKIGKVACTVQTSQWNLSFENFLVCNQLYKLRFMFFITKKNNSTVSIYFHSAVTKNPNSDSSLKKSVE